MSDTTVSLENLKLLINGNVPSVVIPLIKAIFRTFFKNLEKFISDTLNIVVSGFILQMTGILLFLCENSIY